MKYTAVKSVSYIFWTNINSDTAYHHTSMYAEKKKFYNLAISSFKI